MIPKLIERLTGCSCKPRASGDDPGTNKSMIDLIK